MRRILVVEDDPATSSLEQELLGILEYEVRAARTGAEALELARSAAPDAIILDLRLPDIQGAALLEALRAEPALERTPILVVSGAGRLAEDVARRYGASYVAKPFDVVPFLSAVQELDAH